MVLAGPQASRDPGSFGGRRADTLYTHTCLPLHGVTGVGGQPPMGTAAEGGGAGWHVQEASKHTLGSSGSTVTH